MEFKARFNETPELDCARFAAFVDAEGSILIGRSKPSKRCVSPVYSLIVSLGNSSPVLMVWLRDTIGGYVYPIKKLSKWSKRPMWSWHLRGTQAEIVLRRCLPYFLIKREQAEIAVAFSELKRSHSRGTQVPVEHLAQREVLRTKIHVLNSPDTQVSRPAEKKEA